MKKINFILTFLLAWLTGGAALADDYTTVNNYVEAFENQFPADSNGPDFSPAVGWGHYAPGIEINEGEFFHVKYNWMAPAYSFNIEGGSRASIKVGTQDNYSYLTLRTEEDNDMLVTPEITGASSFYAITTSYGGYGSIDVYVMETDADGNLVPATTTKTDEDGNPVKDEDGNPVMVTADPILTIGNDLDTYYSHKYEIPAVTGKRLGIKGNYVRIAYFQADQALVPKVKKLGFGTLPTLNEWANADADGNYTVAFTVPVKNAGTVDIAADDENASVSVVDANGNVITTKPIGVALAVGESTDLDISFTRSYDEYPDPETISLRSDIDGGVTALGTYKPSPHAAAIALSDNLADEDIPSGSEVNFGKTRTNVEKVFYMSNNGGSELTVTGVNLPDGYTSSITAENPLVVPDHSYKTFTVTLSADAVGAKGGTMSFVNDANDNFSLNLKGEVADENTWYADFENMKAPAGSDNENGSWEFGNKGTWNISNDKYYFYVYDYGKNERRLTMPRLKFAEGETLELDAAAKSATSTLKIYYSADCNEWTLAKTINSDDFSKFAKGGFYKFTRFAVDNIPAGSWYISFVSSGACIDNLCGGQLDPAPHAWKVVKSNLPAYASVNSQYKATVTLQNANSVNELGTTYNVTLYVDDEEVATADGVDLTTGDDADAKHEFEVAYTPHHEGEVAVKVVVAAEDDNYSTTVEGTVTVNAETASDDVQIGTLDGDGDDANYRSPFYLFDKNNESEVLLPASKLGDLKAGQTITGLTIRGRNTKPMTKTVTVWIENTTDETMDVISFTPANTDEMTLAFDGSYTYPKTYEYVYGMKTEDKLYGDLLKLDFTTPFVYNGGGIRLHMKSMDEDETLNHYSSDAYFEGDVKENLTVVRHTDGDITSAYLSWVPSRTPVVHFAVAMDPLQYTGAVTDKSGNAIAGADVTLRSGDVEYYATTGDDGSYTAKVVKSGLDYDVDVEAPGYKDTTEPLADLSAAQTTEMSLYGFDLDAGDMVFMTFPFSATADEIDETEGKIYELTSVADGKAKFNKATSVEAYKPYLLVAAKDQDAEDNSFDEFDDKIDLANESTTAVEGADVVTYLSRRHLTAVDAKKSYHLYDGKFNAIDFESEDEDAELFRYTYPFEALLQAAGQGDEIEVELDETPLGISEVNASSDADANAKVYNVAGVRVSNKGVKGLKSGLYIKNGKKVVVK